MATDNVKAPNSTDGLKRLKLGMTLGALGIALAHLVWPSIAIDAVTLGLLLIAVLPWLAPLVKSVELPGGLKVELQEMKEAAAKAEEAGLLTVQPGAPAAEHSFQLVADRDPNLALAGLRIEIERRLVRIAEAHDVPVLAKGVGQLLRSLDQRGALTRDQSSALFDLTGLLNSAVHGAEVDPKAAAWAMEIGPPLLQSLDRLIAPDGTKIFVQPGEPKFPQDGDLWMY